MIVPKIQCDIINMDKGVAVGVGFLVASPELLPLSLAPS